MLKSPRKCMAAGRRGRRPLFFAFFFVILTACNGVSPSVSGERYYSAEFYGLFDTDVTIFTGYAETEDEFNRYADIVGAELTRLHRLFDIYNEYDGLNNLAAVNKNTGITPVSRDIIDLLLLAREVYTLSGGAVNAAMGSVLSLWHDARAAGTAPPGTDALREAARHTDITKLIIDEINNTVCLADPGMSLDVGAVAKAQAAGLAAKAAGEAGLRSGLLSVGGNITAVGKPLDGRDSWSVGIQDPDLSEDGARKLADTVFIAGLTVSCSGGYQRYYEFGGRRYHHIIDPETLMPAELYKQVAVLHPDAGLADLLSTALFILPHEEGAALAARCGAEALWMNADGSRDATEGYKAVSKHWGASP